VRVHSAGAQATAMFSNVISVVGGLAIASSACVQASSGTRIPASVHPVPDRSPGSANASLIRVEHVTLEPSDAADVPTATLKFDLVNDGPSSHDILRYARVCPSCADWRDTSAVSKCSIGGLGSPLRRYWGPSVTLVPLLTRRVGRARRDRERFRALCRFDLARIGLPWPCVIRGAHHRGLEADADSRLDSDAQW
jgi:hypothetical protein